MIFRGTTPTITIDVANDDGSLLNLSQYTNYFSISDGYELITITNDRMTFNQDLSVDMVLTQEETLKLQGKNLFFQLRAIKNGVAIATLKAMGKLEDILKEGVINEA